MDDHVNEKPAVYGENDSEHPLPVSWPGVLGQCDDTHWLEKWRVAHTSPDWWSERQEI